MIDDTKDTKDDKTIETADPAAAENNDADDANPDAEPQQPEIPFGIVYDDETDDKPGSPNAAEAGGCQPAMDQTDALIASFLGTDAASPSATDATPVSKEKPAEAAPVMVASKIDREITNNDSIVFSTYPTLAFKHVTYTVKKGAEPLIDDADFAFHSRRLYAVRVHSDEQRIAAISLMANMAHPTTGHVMFKSKDLEELTGAEYRGHFAGLIPQLNAVRGELSAMDNIVNAMEGSGRNFLKPKPLIAESLLNKVGVASEYHDALVATMPDVMRRRVAIAKALCCEPSLIIADNPVLDIEDPERGELLDLFKRIAHKDGKTVIIIDSTDGPLPADRTYML